MTSQRRRNDINECYYERCGVLEVARMDVPLIIVRKLDSKGTVGKGGQISIANTAMPSTFHPVPILLDLDSINHI